MKDRNDEQFIEVLGIATQGRGLVAVFRRALIFSGSAPGLFILNAKQLERRISKACKNGLRYKSSEEALGKLKSLSF